MTQLRLGRSLRGRWDGSYHQFPQKVTTIPNHTKPLLSPITSYYSFLGFLLFTFILHRLPTTVLLSDLIQLSILHGGKHSPPFPFFYQIPFPMLRFFYCCEKPFTKRKRKELWLSASHTTIVFYEFTPLMIYPLLIYSLFTFQFLSRPSLFHFTCQFYFLCTSLCTSWLILLLYNLILCCFVLDWIGLHML